MSEDEWIDKRLPPGARLDEADRLRRVYRSVVKDLMETVERRMHERANEITKAWPAQAERDEQLASVIHAAIRHAEEMGRDYSVIAPTRRATTEHNLILFLREYAKADDAWVQENRRKPTRKEQAARDAYLAARHAARDTKAADRKARVRPPRPTADEVAEAVRRNPKVVPLKRRAPPRDDGGGDEAD